MHRTDAEASISRIALIRTTIIRRPGADSRARAWLHRARRGLTLAVTAALGTTLLVAAPAPALAAANGCSDAALLGISGWSQYLTRWVDANAATPGGLGSPSTVGRAGRVRLIASDSATGDLFALDSSGRLRLYQFSEVNGWYNSGTPTDPRRHADPGQTAWWTDTGTIPGWSWGRAVSLIADGDGVLYAVTREGGLYWFRWTDQGFATGSGTRVGTGWNQFRMVFGGGHGVLYGVRWSDGALVWRHNLTTGLSTPRWTVARKVASGWQGFKAIMGAGGGRILAVRPDGRMLWYFHTGAGNGAARWGSGSGSLVGTGFAGFSALTVNPNACSPLPTTPVVPGPTPPPTPKPTPPPPPTNSGAYSLPIPSGLLSRARFTSAHHDYPALDLPVRTGTLVRAVRQGKVVATTGLSTTCGYGAVVDANDGGRYTYCHMSKLYVKAGQALATGARIGLSGSTGNSTGPHLHLQIKSPTSTLRCPQRIMLAIIDKTKVPLPSSLPTTGCFYATSAAVAAAPRVAVPV